MNKPVFLSQIRSKNLKKIRLFFKDNFLSVTLLFLCIFIIVLILKSNFFAIIKVDCKTQYGKCKPEEARIYEEYKGRNLFTLDVSLVKNLGERIFTNRRVFVQKVFPNTLVVVLEKKTPTVSVKLDIQQKGYFLVDNEGNVIEYAEESRLPVIVIKEGTASLVIGKTLGEKFANAAKIFSLVTKSQQTKDGYYDGESFKLDLTDSTTVFFPLDRDPQILVGALQLILTRSRIEEELPKIIDLRYSNPVLRYE